MARKRTDPVYLWRAILQAGGIDAYIEAQLAERGVKVEKKETAGMSARVSPSTVDQSRYGSIRAVISSVSNYPISPEAAVNAVGDFLSSLLVGFLWSTFNVQTAFTASALLFFAGALLILRLRI